MKKQNTLIESGSLAFFTALFLLLGYLSVYGLTGILFDLAGMLP